MSVHSAIVKHTIGYAKRRLGDEIEKKLLEGTNFEFSDHTQLRDRIKFSDARLVAENFYEIFGKYEFRKLGRDLIKYYNEHVELVKYFPLVSTLKFLPPIKNMDRQTFDFILGTLNQFNSAHKHELIEFSTGYLELSIKKNPRFQSSNKIFKLPDSEFIDCACQHHMGGIEEAFKLLKAEKLKIEEKFHQGSKVGGQVIPHCLYQISWKDDTNLSMDKVDNNYIVNKNIADDFWKYCKKKGISYADLRTMGLFSKGMKLNEIAHQEHVTESAIKKRIEKLRNIFSVKRTVDVIKIFEKEGYIKFLHDIRIT